MTSINKLTKNSVINSGDLLVIWDEENQRTRSISYDTLKAAVPYLEKAEYVSPNLILTQSNGEFITVAIPSGGDVISGLLGGQVPVKDQATGQLVYSGATVNPSTGQWTFDRTIEVPSSSLNVGDVVTISEGSTDLLISNNIDGIVSAAVSYQIDSTGAKAPSYFKFGEEKSFIPQPFDSEVITTNPLVASSIGRVVSPDVRQINQTIFRADQSMPNTVAEIKDKASGMVIKYIPSRAAWEATTAEDRARNPGLNFIAGDNVIDYVSREEDTPGVFNIGVSPFRLTEGQEFEVIIKADVMALKGISGVPYLAEMVQDGPEVFLLSEDGQYIDEIIAGNNVTVDSTNPKKPVISASGGSGGAGVTIDVDGVEITTGVDTLDFDSATMTILDENPSDGTVKISAKIQDQTNFIGLFNTVSELQADYPTPKDGMYASVLDADGKPDDRYKSQSDSWVGIGAVSGDVFVNDNKSLGIITGDGLKYEDDSGNAKISLSGVTPVIEFDVTIDSTRTVSPSMVGEVITIIQTPPVISIPMIISLEAHANFSIGDTITISADRDGENQYTNYYFAVNYTDATGRNLVKYPANNIAMIRTGGGWNVSMDGRYTNVSIRPKSQFGIPYAPDEQYNTPVNAFVFAESPAVEFDIDEDTNTRIVKVDLDNIAPDLSGYIQKYSRADLDYVRIAYDGKYNNERAFYPVQLNQDSNGWTNFLFTGYMQFQALDKATGDKGNKVLELRSDRVIAKAEPYYNDYKLAVRANNNIANTSSLADVINSDGDSVKDWKDANPDYTPQELLDQIFNSTVVGFNDFQLELTLSANDYNSTVPVRFGKWVIRRSPDPAISYMYVHDKESSDVYRAYYEQGKNPEWKLTSYISDIDEIVNDRLGAIFNPESSVDITLKDLEASNSGYDVSYGSFDYVGDNVRFPRWENTIAEAPHYNGLNASYILFRVEDVARFLGRDLDQNDNELGIDLTSASGGLGQYSTTLPINEVLGAKWDYRGRAITDLLPTNPDGSSDGTKQDANNPSIYLKDDGSTTENGTEAKEKIYTPHKLKKQKNFFGRGWGFALRRGYVKRDKTFSYSTSSNYYVCVFDISSGIAADKHHTFNFTYPEAKIYNSIIDAEMAENAIARIDDVNENENIVYQNQFKSKSGYSSLVSGGGSTKTVTYGDNAKILKISNSTVKVEMLEGMNAEDKPHGYFKYINTKNSDVNFEWYDRSGTQVTNNVPSICPANVVVEVFADYSLNQYVLTFSESKIISSSIAEAQTPSFSKFINKSTVTVNYPLDANYDQYRPINVAVMVLDTDNLISDLNITVTSSDSYDGHYNSIGVIAIDSNGEWTTQSRRNGYRLDDGTNTYCVYSDSLNSWVLVVASVDHNHIGSIVGGTPINLYDDGQLPESYGDYSIDNNLDSIESEYFTKADVEIDYHTNSGANSYFTVDFGNAKPAGIIFYK